MDEQEQDRQERNEGDAQARGQRRQSRRRLLATLGVAGLGAAGLGIARAFGFGAPTPQALVRSTAMPPSTSTPEPTATPDTRPVTVVMTGDIMLARTVGQQMVAAHDEFPFNYTGSFLRGFDLTVGNLECVVSTLGSPEPKQFTFEASPIGFQRLVDAGFRVVSVANNHSGDYGKAAFADMLQQLSQYAITPIGGGMTYAEAHSPIFRLVRGTTIGFLAYCEIGPEYFAATQTVPGHAWLEPDAMRADIAAARPLCDFLIVFTHWGIEYTTVETGHQQDMAHLAIDAGADLVVGCHPHVIQPSEIYRGKPIVYSLGNFVFDYMTAPLTSSCHVLTLSIQGSKLLDWKLVHATIGDWGQPALG